MNDLALTITIPPEARSLIQRLGDSGGMLRAVAREMDLQNELTIGHIQRTRLSQRGPETLGVRTGLLRRSLRRSKATVTENGVTSSIGTNVRYAGVHEFGFTGTVNVPQHSRKIVAGTAIAFTASGRKKKIKVGGTTVVRAHTRKMNFPARAPIRRGIQDRAIEYGRALGAAAIAFYTRKGTQ